MYTAPSARASAAYRQVDLNSLVMGASSHGLIALLFNELRTSLVCAKASIVQRDVSNKVRLMAKASRLLDEGLMSSLDVRAGGEIAGNLHTLYSYCLVRLAQANAQNDTAIVDEVLQVLEPVMQGWNVIGDQARA